MRVALDPRVLHKHHTSLCFESRKCYSTPSFFMRYRNALKYMPRAVDDAVRSSLLPHGARSTAGVSVVVQTPVNYSKCSAFGPDSNGTTYNSPLKLGQKTKEHIS